MNRGEQRDTFGNKTILARIALCNEVGPHQLRIEKLINGLPSLRSQPAIIWPLPTR